MKILIVDDDPATRKHLCHTLRSLSHEVIEAPGGAEALKLLSAGDFEIMISDILMPNMDGYRLCFEARQTPRLKELRIILYSAYLSPSDGDLALRFGASAFLVKPASPERLKELLREVCLHPAPAAASVPEIELGMLKQYSERLITKIEENNLDLLRRTAELEASEEKYRKLAENMEGKNVELLRRTEELAASEEKFRQLAENIQEVFFITNTDFSQILYVSPAYEAVWGRSPRDLYQHPGQWIESIYPEDREQVSALMAPSPGGPSLFTWDYRILRPDGKIRSLRVRGFPIRDQSGKIYRYAGFAEDVTERKNLELQLVQSQKMEAVGRLAGGIAHDFNNLLTAINGYSQLCLQTIDDRDPLYKDIDEIRKAGERAAGLTRQLLAFSRKQILQPRVISLNTVVSDMERLLKRLIGEDIELATSLSKDLGSVKADPGQIEQVVVNLAVNARDAMPKGGRLILETANVDLDDTYVSSQQEVKSGRYVMIALSDTGTGMSASVKAHLFEPFFTTKELGKGTGLGLATVHGIVKQSGGHIGCYSELGRGTTFKVYLPRLDVPPEVIRKGVHRLENIRGTETILLIEDEPVVRALARTVLSKAGYKVLDASRGEEALLLAQQYVGIDLVVSDLIMPGMNGLEITRRLGDIKPGLRTIYMSGYTDAAILNEGILGSDMPFLSKPFTPDALLRKVREVLDAGKGANAVEVIAAS